MQDSIFNKFHADLTIVLNMDLKKCLSRVKKRKFGIPNTGINIFEHRLDEGIIDTRWLSINEAELLSNEMRSPLVLQNLRDFIEKDHHPLSVISTEYLNSVSNE